MNTLLLLAVLAQAAAPVRRVPALPRSAVVAPAPYARMTGALYRSQADPGPVKRMWVVFKPGEKELVAEAVAKIAEHNPGVEVAWLEESQAIPVVKNEKGEESVDRQALFDSLLADKAEFVLATNQDIYEKFRGLRDSNLAREIPMGYAGRKSVSVDMPRASLDPAVLSDPRAYAARRYLWLGADGAEKAGARMMAGMEGVRMSLQGVLKSDAVEGHGGAKKDEDMGLVARMGTKLMMKLARQADDAETQKLREEAHHLAAYIAKEKIDVLATDDARATKVVGLMKQMGYHKSLAVVWASREKPADASGVNMTVVPAPWLGEARHVAVSPQPNLSESLAAAVKQERLPDNFMDMGGVSVRDFEPAVAEAVEKALPGKRPKGTYDVHFMLTNGNGVKNKGDANAFGHFGLAVTDEKGKAQVWTVQYNDGGSFTGGLGDQKQLSLGEYLYTLWYLPGAVGQAIPLAETAVSPVFDFILRGVDEAQLEAMRRKAAEINARHLKGGDNYSFLNNDGMTNCISMVTQILRAAGFRIPETSIQDPAGQAMNMFAELSRWLLNGRITADRFGFVVFERPAHAGPEHYRITNTALASPLFNRPKPWERMAWYEKAWRFLTFPWNLAKAMSVPEKLEAFARLATHRVVVGPASRDPQVVENAASPIMRLRAGAQAVASLRRARVGLMERIETVEQRIIKAIGFEGWTPNPAQTLEEQARGKGTVSDDDLRRHHRLTVELELNNIDELIERRRMEFLTLELADPTHKHIWKVEGIKSDYQTVLSYRDRVLIQDRVLTDEEKEQLDVLNARLERRLERARVALLKEVGPSAAQSVKMILGQVDRETLEALKELGAGGDGKKGKDAKGK